MDALLKSGSRPGLTLIVDWPDQEPALEVTARLALVGPVRVIVGGNRFDAHQLARVVRRLTVQVDATLERIELARPFTCYQMVTLLAQTRPTAPLILLDALTPFYDENISQPESVRLMRTLATHLRSLKQQTPLLATVRPSPMPQRSGLVKLLRGIADQVYIYMPPQEPIQSTLF